MPSEAKQWVACYVATIQSVGSIAITKSAFIVMANSKYEANGIAMAICKKACPSNEGYKNHDVAVTLASECIITDPNTAVTIRNV